MATAKLAFLGMSKHSQNGDASSANTPLTSKPSGAAKPPDGPDWLARYPWVALVLPFAVYMLCGALEPTADKPFKLGPIDIEYIDYPMVYTAKILITMAAMVAVGSGYRQFPFRVTLLAPVVGAVGVVAWIGICKLNLEKTLLGPLGLDAVIGLGKRSAFDPFARWPDDPQWAYGFLTVRFWGLVFVVPVIEEFFIRAFVMRFVIETEWWKIPFGTLTPLAIAAGTLVPVLLHPAEIFAAAVWFTAVTWLMFRTKSIWDCVVAHAVTNLLLGIWVVSTGDWYFL